MFRTMKGESAALPRLVSEFFSTDVVDNGNSESRKLSLRSSLLKTALSLMSSILLVCSLPAPGQGWMAWFALVPLIIACKDSAPLGAAGLGFVSGFAAAFGIYSWIFEVSSFTAIHSLLGGTYLAMYPALWCLGIALSFRLGIRVLFSAPAIWIALDYLRANAGFLAVPWGTLAHTQHQNLAVLQVASFTGEYGVTFLVVLANAALTHLILTRDWRSFGGAAVIVVGAHGVGWIMLSQPAPGPTLRVAAIQPAIADEERSGREGWQRSLERHEQLTRETFNAGPALVVWPETAVTGNFASDPSLESRLQEFTRIGNISLAFGASEVEKFVVGDQANAKKPRAFNSAYLISAGGPIGLPYHKRMLVPFGEYLPLKDYISWPSWFVGETYETAAGGEAHNFTLPDGTPIGASICWENLFPRLARESVQAGARVLVQLTNDAAFGRTAASLQHNLASVLRAVENRVPVVIASNTGPSQIIDAHGRVVAKGPGVFRAGVVYADISLGSGETIYSRYGDAFVFVLMGVLGFTMVSRVKMNLDSARTIERFRRPSG